jgi:hypothetical protein
MTNKHLAYPGIFFTVIGLAIMFYGTAINPVSPTLVFRGSYLGLFGLALLIGSIFLPGGGNEKE